MSIKRIDFDESSKISLDYHYDKFTDKVTTIRNQDTTDIEKSVQERKNADDGTLDDDFNIIAQLPRLLIEKWQQEINGEDILADEHRGFFREKLNSAEAKQYIIKDGYLL